MNKIIAILVILVLSYTLLASPRSGLLEDILFISNLYEDGYYDMALREIARIEGQLTNDEDSYHVLLIKADIFIKKGDLRDARQILIRLNNQTLTPATRAQVILSLATLEMRLNNVSEAHDLINIFITRFPDNPRMQEAYQLLGDIYFHSGQYEQAEVAYRRMGDRLSLATNMIKVYAKRGQLPEAEVLLTEIRRDHPRSHQQYQEGLYHILSAYETRGDFQSIIRLCPSSFDAKTAFSEPSLLKKISAFIHLRQFTEAQQLLSHIRDDTRNVSYYRALIHKQKGEDNLALPIFRSLANANDGSQVQMMSFFNMTQIIAKTNTNQAREMLSDFLVQNPDQEWEGDILFQIGFIDYRNGRHDIAYDTILRSLDFRLNDTNLRNALYLKGELEFLLNQYERAFDTFIEFYELMPEQFIDEVIFKLGLTAYFTDRIDTARMYFLRLVGDHPASQKVGIAYYYLGEMELHRNTMQARSYFQQALSGDMDRGVIYLRLAYVEFLRQDFPAALDRLNAVPETPDYLYDKHLLRGNILFAQRKFTEALEAYRIAERSALDQVSVEYVWSRQAWTYYSMQQYDRATAIYRRLAEQSDTPGRYILSAAGAAFNADNFEQAMEIYLEYISSYPNSTRLYRAQIGLANSYFNLGRLQQAIDIWKLLVNENQPPRIVDSSLKGLQASYQRLNSLPLFSEFLNLTISRSRQTDFVIALYEFKAFFEYEQRNYTGSISTLQQLFREHPQKREDQKLMILLANNYTWTNRFEEADQIYVELTLKYDDPFIYHEWGHIKWAQRDFRAAIVRYKRAAERSQNEQYWLVLLERMVEQRDPEFMRFYNQFTGFASVYHQTLAKLYLVDWLIYERNFTTALARTEEVMSSDFSLLRAQSIFKRGEIFYLMQNFEESLANFLRIRYVFSEFSDLRWRAELRIAMIYHAQGHRDRARTLFDSIRPNLSPQQISEYNSFTGQ
jgi:tetratricopeptide (TPR) repeat protein